MTSLSRSTSITFKKKTSDQECHLTTSNVDKDMEQLSILGGNQNWDNYLGNHLLNTGHVQNIWSISLQSIYTKEMCAYVHWKKCTEISIVISFKTAPRWKPQMVINSRNDFAKCGIFVQQGSNQRLKTMNYYQTNQHGWVSQILKQRKTTVVCP